MWGRWRRRAEDWLEGWDRVVAAQLHHWARLDGEERGRLGALIEWMVRTKSWEAAQGFALTQDMVVSIAAHASLLILNVDRRAYRDVRAVVIHPGAVTRRGPWSTTVPGVVCAGPRRLLGHASGGRGPVVISWEALGRNRRRPEAGHNVVLHEFAHKIDAVDGLFDGTPELSDRHQRSEWTQVCTSEYERLRASQKSDPVLRPYAATNPSEFFAVATETFFERPLELDGAAPELYRVLQGYYRQDPAGRTRRAAL